MWKRIRPALFVITLAIVVSNTAAAASPGGYGAVIGTGPGVGVYNFNSIEVTRTYSAGGFTLPGTILPLQQTIFPPGVPHIDLGWSYMWPDAKAGPNINAFTVQFDFAGGPNFGSYIFPCDVCKTSLGVSEGPWVSHADGIWHATGYGNDRDHTFGVSGFAGSNQYSWCCNPDGSGDQTIAAGSGSYVVPPALNGEVRLPFIGTMDFADQGTGMIEIDYVYDPGPAACLSSAI